MRPQILSALVLVLAACGTSSEPSSSPPAPSSTPAPTPVTGTPAPTPVVPPPSGGPGAPPGSPAAELLAIVRNAHERKVRMTVDMMHGGATRSQHMVLEIAPPDRRHAVMDMAMGPRTTHTETIIIGDHGWMRRDDGAWQTAPQPSMMIGNASAQSMIDEMARRVESGQVTVAEGGMVGGMHTYRIESLPNAAPGGGTWQATMFVGGNGLPDHVDGTMTGGMGNGTTTHQAFAYDDSIQIEAPL